MQTSLDFRSTLAPFYANELVVSYKRSKQLSDAQFKRINSSAKSADLLRELWHGDLDVQESFYIICFDCALNTVGYKKIADGGLDYVPVDIRLIFSAALLCNARSIIIAHNHPSGSLEPSNADKSITEKIKEAGKLLDIRLNDHIILTKEGYYSFLDNHIL